MSFRVVNPKGYRRISFDVSPEARNALWEIKRAYGEQAGEDGGVTLGMAVSAAIISTNKKLKSVKAKRRDLNSTEDVIKFIC